MAVLPDELVTFRLQLWHYKNIITHSLLIRVSDQKFYFNSALILWTEHFITYKDTIQSSHFLTHTDLIQMISAQPYQEISKESFPLFDVYLHPHLSLLHLHNMLPVPVSSFHISLALSLSPAPSACPSSVISKDIWATSPPCVIERAHPDSLPPEWAMWRVAYFLHSSTRGNKTVRKKKVKDTATGAARSNARKELILYQKESLQLASLLNPLK